MSESLGEYLNRHHARQLIDFAIRVVSTSSGAVQFYIRPAGANGDTVDFFAVGETVIPAAVDGLVSEFRPALEQDCRKFAQPERPWACPKCQSDISGFLMEQNWYIALDGGMGVSTPEGPGEPWVMGVQLCPTCGYQWVVED